MSERQNIDRLFQEKFKDFEATPSDKVWANIQREMNPTEKKKEPVLLPLWLKLCGVAAVFLIGFFIGSNFFFSTPQNQINTSSATGVASDEKKETKDTDSNKNNTVINKESFNADEDTNTITATVEDKEAASTYGTQNQNALPHGNHAGGSNKSQNTSFQNRRFGTKKDTKQAAFNHNNSSSSVASLESNGSNTRRSNAQNTVGFETNKVSDNSASVNQQKNTNSQLALQIDGAAKTPVTVNEPEMVTENSADLLFANPNSKVAFEVGKERYSDKKERGILIKSYIPNDRKTTTNPSESLLAKDEKLLKKSIAPKTTVVSTTDSLQKAKGKETPNPLDQLLKEKEEQEKEVKKQTAAKNKWLVSSKVTPIFMNASGSSSAIDQQFDNNERNYETTFSYGMGISYAVTDRLSVRTGVHSLNMKYRTDGIVYYQSKEARSMENIRRNETGSSIQIEDKDSRVMAFNGASIVTQKTSGAISQQMGYIEVPTEVSYKVLNKKFGIEVIGGLSTLFLTQNDVSLISAQRDMKIGEASNLNNIHLSSNIGLGFKYSFSKSFEANMEPMFKYQINTYRNNAGDFKPYYMGVYTGISYRF